jgi:hypothetical protein
LKAHFWHKRPNELDEMLDQIYDRINEQNRTFDELHHYEIACHKLLTQVQMLKQTHESTKYTPAVRELQFDINDEMATDGNHADPTTTGHDDVAAVNLTDDEVDT